MLHIYIIYIYIQLPSANPPPGHLLVVWLVHWLVGLLGWLVGSVVCWWIGSVAVGWMAGWLVGWMAGGCIHAHVGVHALEIAGRGQADQTKLEQKADWTRTPSKQPAKQPTNQPTKQKSTKLGPKIHPKSTKLEPKSTKMEVKIVQNRSQDASGRGLGQVLGPRGPQEPKVVQNSNVGYAHLGAKLEPKSTKNRSTGD